MIHPITAPRRYAVTRFFAALGLLSTIYHPLSTLAQGNLAPPGAPGPAMKSLDQIEARTIVNSNNTPGDSLSLFKITSSGSYYFTANVTGVSGKHGIVIAAPNVTLDLNGFSLLGVAGSLDGINASNSPALAAGLIVRNGIISGWGTNGNGINTQTPTFTPGAPGARFANLLLLNNGLSGLRAAGAVITDCAAQSNTVAGGNSAYGIHAIGSRVVNCLAKANANGFQGSGGSVIEGCVATDNGAGLLADNSTILHCAAYNSTFEGMFLFGNNRVVGNLIDGNGHGTGIIVAGSSAGNVLDENTLINNPTAGITLAAGGVANNFVIRNSVHGSGASSYLTGANNSFGPIVNVAGTNDISTVTNASHPWANFSY